MCERLLLSLVCVALCAAAVPPGAMATHVSCGEAITEDTALDSDLACAGDGVTIAADDVTFDLRGHLIEGTGQVGTGVAVDRVARPEIRNGTVRGFRYAIEGEDTDGYRVARMVLRDSIQGLDVFQNEGSGEVVDTTAAHNRLGLNLDGGVRVTRSRIVGNEQIGIALDFAGATLVGNLIARNETGIDIEEANAVIERNWIVGNTEHGLRYGYWQDGTVRENVISRNGTGLSAGISRLTIERNVFTANERIGLSATGLSKVLDNVARRNGEDGIAVAAAECGEVRDNVSSANGRNGLRVGGSGPEDEPCDGPSVVEGNQASENGADGILVTRLAGRLVLTGNRADRNRDDGIDVDPQAASQLGFDWSPDARVLAIGLRPRDEQPHIWLVRADDTGNRRLVAGSHPVWSPDGAEIVFRGSFGGQSGLWAIRPHGGGLRFVTATVGEDIQWSPDGERIYLRDPEGIKAVPAAGGPATLLARGSDPELSPAGDRIVFRRGADVWTMNSDGTDQRLLLEQSAYPSWSPDGERLVLSDGFELLTITPDGSDLRLLTTDEPANIWPDWSPDGELIVFQQVGAGAPAFSWHTIRPDGSDPARLSDAFGTPPRWTPDSRGVASGNVVANRDGSVTTLSPGENPLVTLTGNRADRNSDLGIEAADGVVDGGGNRARRNGDPRQCLNVDCS